MTLPLFPDAPVQRPGPVCTDWFALDPCVECGGTGETLAWPDHVDPCPECRGGGVMLRRVGR